jgi:hypothetical protein
MRYAVLVGALIAVAACDDPAGPGEIHACGAEMEEAREELATFGIIGEITSGVDANGNWERWALTWRQDFGSVPNAVTFRWGGSIQGCSVTYTKPS